MWDSLGLAASLSSVGFVFTLEKLAPQASLMFTLAKPLGSHTSSICLVLPLRLHG